jgi:hypothetical protein
MKEDEERNRQSPVLEAVVGVFDDPAAARRAAVQLKSSGLDFVSVPRRGRRGSSSSHTGQAALERLSEIFFEPSDHITSTDVAAGAGKGAAMGAAAGLVLVAVPGIGLAAVLGGALGGAFIGGIAAIDEGDRSINLPSLDQYRQMLAEGQALIVAYGDETLRLDVEHWLKAAGAIHTYQHPPVLHAVRHIE